MKWLLSFNLFDPSVWTGFFWPLPRREGRRQVVEPEMTKEASYYDEFMKGIQNDNNT